MGTRPRRWAACVRAGKGSGGPRSCCSSEVVAREGVIQLDNEGPQRELRMPFQLRRRSHGD